MMRSLRLALLLCCSLFISGSLFAQLTPDPTTWTFEAKKISGNQYDLIFHLKLKKYWHIYSFKPGGDGSLIAPSFNFDKNSNVKLIGTVKEKGKLITENMDGIDGAVNLYKNQVDYVQTASITGSTKISGKHLYQVCNDSSCLPPKTKSFSFTIGDVAGTASAT